MKIVTKFSPGDKVYVVVPGGPCIDGPMTIGQVRVEVTDSPGRAGEKMFHNYMAKQGCKEEYMMVETGIGTGVLHPAHNLFANLEEAARELDNHVA